MRSQACFKSGNAVFAGDDFCGFDDALLLFAGDGGIVFFPGGVDFLAGLGRGSSEGEDGSVDTGFERGEQHVRGAGEHLEADFLFAGNFGEGGAMVGAMLPVRTSAETKSGRSALTSVSAIIMRLVKAAKTGVTSTVRLGAERVAATSAARRSMEPEESLMAMMLGCWASSATMATGSSQCGEFGDAVKDDGQRGAVSEGAVVGDEASGIAGEPVVGRVVVRGADEEGVVLVVGGVFGEAKGFGEAFAGDAGEQDFFRSSGVGGVAEDVAGFVVAQHDGFAGGTEDDEAGAGRAGVVLDVGLELAQVEAAVGVERSGDRRENAIE